ncbi:MAG: 30S ribosomal protein S13 [Candidatus Magasanikbacteria bacterium CG10_big_fil_rev_8_21_14_0_10_40_10]|uniref:Small ribosomal subunit protein uS13 n=1 Tax=Candidatus Magasanikbacteria bacterium CG10_big_fil_rev_8_21_14_0_10_40_10 TaxID=1974648 RepID=A0A2M6W4U7_9BACT|nr:MAG: 30S ribosomal protein S13 [Candidatus Magasanikbacteria bacterium CG10_big_fil_rev_8_21_14_0_10_40_10]
MRVSGVNLPKEKRIIVALTYVFGIGPKKAEEILKKSNLDENIRTKDLTREQEDLIRQVIEKEYKTEGDLRREILANIKRLKEIKCYRGTRHSRHLPARGQTSRVNSRTVRGNVRKTTGSGRKPTAQKT